MTQHTPGPWTGAKKGMHWVVRSAKGYLVAHVLGRDADAQLIAQAPALREALATIAAFQFSPIAEDKGYGVALEALCVIKRHARAILAACDGSTI